MKWFHNLSFRYKLMLPIVVLAGLFIYMAVDGMLLINNLGKKSRELANLDLASVNYLLQADRDLYQAQVAERSMLFVDVESDNFKSLAKQHSDNIRQARERMVKFAALVNETDIDNMDSIREKLQLYETARGQWETLTQKVYSERASNTRVGRSNSIELSFESASTAFEQMRDQIDALSEIMLKHADQASNASEADASRGNVHMTFTLVVGTLLCVLLVFVLPPLVTAPMLRLIEHMENAAQGNGDLTVRLDDGNRDEMGRLARAFNRFVEKLQTMIQQSVESTAQLSDASQRLTLVSSDSMQAVSQQLSEIDQVATGMDEMTATVQEVARNASQAAEAAHESDNQARKGKEVVNQTVQSIRDLASSVQSSAGIIQKLQEESGNIGTVLGVIKGIAEQTNLLALNAAIEAARAGEQGRGFAVVADEVRQLASRTQQSTQEIQNMIESLQSSARQAVDSMEAGREKADQSVSQADLAGQALEEIARAVGTITDMNTQIASAAEEQAAVTDELNRNTVNIQNLANHSSDGSQKTAAAADELASLSEGLKDSLSQFRV